MVLRSCSSLATSSFWPARVATASLSCTCSSAQRTAKQSQGCHGGAAPQPVPRGHQRAEKPPWSSRASSEQQPCSLFCLREPQQPLPSTRVQPSLGMLQGGHIPGRSSATSQGQRQLPAMPWLLQRHQPDIFGVPGVPGALAGQNTGAWRGLRGAELMN